MWFQFDSWTWAILAPVPSFRLPSQLPTLPGMQHPPYPFYEEGDGLCVGGHARVVGLADCRPRGEDREQGDGAQTATRRTLATFAGSGIQRLRSKATITRSSTWPG